MQINWKLRLKSKQFWITLIPALLLLAQVTLYPFGIEVPTVIISDWAMAFINALFAVLVILGIVTDPTTEGVSDSTRAMYYDKPR